MKGCWIRFPPIKFYKSRMSSQAANDRLSMTNKLLIDHSGGWWLQEIGKK